MKVRVTHSVVGRGFAFERGDEVDDAEFSAKVGTGWKALCEPAKGAERAVKDTPAERRSK